MAHYETSAPQIGVSGFRVDLGIIDPDATGSYLAGVEGGGATYHRGATARDRDRLRQHVLETLGWRILHVWSTDWWTNVAREAVRLHGQLGDALSGRAPNGQQGPSRTLHLTWATCQLLEPRRRITAGR